MSDQVAPRYWYESDLICNLARSICLSEYYSFLPLGIWALGSACFFVGLFVGILLVRRRIA
jgi:hypothetical protein